ncbi:MAG: zinc ribbon domain-containing protein [Bacteroidales bacterium]|nr:zinc ribbon domain-containing protein [Bacteroidales bacterium]
MEVRFCQSCGMPLRQTEDLGTNVDQTPNEDFCRFCYQDGNFTQDVTMEMMIEHCAQFVDEFNKDSAQKLTHEEAISQMREYFPHLKRWKNETE